jgi:two-component system, OmpR family, phosphate regulon sensor histidine kinase PhoR
MFTSLRSRMAIAYVALMVACVGALTGYLVFIAEDAYFATLRDGVDVQAKLVSVAARPFLSTPHAPSEIDALAKQLGREAGVRVTIIDRTGVVLGDSESDPATMENHATRPEVAAALKGDQSESQRRSATVGYDTLYVATPIVNQGQILGVARVALPLDRVNSVSSGLVLAVTLGGLAAIILAVLVAFLIARGIAGPINVLTTAAGRMAKGDLDQRILSRSNDEIGRLADAFDTMADRLQTTVKTISAEKNTLTAVLSTMADGILIVENGRVTMANRAASALLGAAISTLQGSSYVEALRDHELSGVLQRCLAEGTQQSGTAEVGSARRLLRIVAAPLRGEQRGALALLQDLTEVRRAEMVRRDFIANVSHELRTPLASLKAVVETLEEGAIDEPEVARDFLSKMHGEVDGMSHLVSELLELSRIESGQVALRVEPEDVEALERESAGRLAAQAERSGLKLGVEVPPDLPMVAADRQRIQQVLLNLIHNAIKFTPPDGKITVGARREGDWMVLSVADTGAGIPAEDLPRIFERFYKADRSRSNSGTGLGLAIAKHVVQAHGGRIWVESVEGRGSTFYFTLPVTSDE